MDMEITSWISPVTGLPCVRWKQRRPYVKKSLFRSFDMAPVDPAFGVRFHHYNMVEEEIMTMIDDNDGLKLVRELTDGEREEANRPNSRQIGVPVNEIQGFVLSPAPRPVEKNGNSWIANPDRIDLDRGHGDLLYWAMHFDKPSDLAELRASLHRRYITQRPRGGWQFAPFDQSLRAWPQTNQQAIDLKNGLWNPDEVGKRSPPSGEHKDPRLADDDDPI